MSYYYPEKLNYILSISSHLEKVSLVIGKQQFIIKSGKERIYRGEIEYNWSRSNFLGTKVKLELYGHKEQPQISGFLMLRNARGETIFFRQFKRNYKNDFISLDLGETTFKAIIVKSAGYHTESTKIEWISSPIKLSKESKNETKNDKLQSKVDSDKKIVQIFYCTNRKKTGNIKPNLFYGSKLGLLEYGACFVNIPKNHTQGNIERPGKVFWIWSLQENMADHIILKKVEEKKESDFYEWLKSNLPQTKNKSALLFIHGYNNTFAEAAWRTAQIAYDTPFDGLTGFFSWPSSGKKLSYFADEAKAIASIPSLEKFIEDFIVKTEVEKLHIIAHSMGNVVVTGALNNLVQKESFKPYIKVIDQIILAAPDLDQQVFNNTLLPKLKGIGSKRTLYASDKDEALNISTRLRGNMPRLGQGGGHIYVAEGIDSIDASDVMSFGNHHSYIFETKELLMDMNLLFEKNMEPRERRLLEKYKKGLLYWFFRK